MILDVDKDAATETIGIEYNPQGAYRFFHFTLNDIQNQIYSLSDVMGNIGKRLIELINRFSRFSKVLRLRNGRI